MIESFPKIKIMKKYIHISEISYYNEDYVTVHMISDHMEIRPDR